MKTKLRLWRGGGTLILAAGLALGSAPVVSAAGAEVDLDVVTKVVTAYQDLLDSHWTDSNCSLSSCVNASSSVFASSGDKKSQRGSSFGGSSKDNRDERKNSGENPKFTQAEATILRVRDDMKEFGLPIVSAKSTISVTDAKMNADGKVTVSADIGTTKTYQGSDDPSYMSDIHTLTLSLNKENVFAVIEDVVAPMPQEEILADKPENVDFNDVPVDRILGVESAGNNQLAVNPVGANGDTAKFSLLPSHQDQSSVVVKPVLDPFFRQPKPDVEKMVAYALHWSREDLPRIEPVKSKEDVNPNYPNQGTNCTNFASQALEAGGWKRKLGVDSRDSDAWHPFSKDRAHDNRIIPTSTWGAAANLYGYAKTNGPYHDLGEKEFAQKGDLIFVDWDPNNKFDGKIDHTMVVTGTISASSPKGRFTTPRISQKTRNRHNITFREVFLHMGESGKEPKNARWYALGLK